MFACDATQRYAYEDVDDQYCGCVCVGDFSVSKLPSPCPVGIVCHEFSKSRTRKLL